MDPLFVVLGLLGLISVVGIAAQRREKRTGQKLGRGAAANMLGAVNEAFQPLASNASLILEEQKNRVVATPSPEDKDLGRLIRDFEAKKQNPRGC